MSALPRILVFDSGVGCLSITSEILRKIPHCHLACAVDNAFFPYGTKDDSALADRIVEQIDFFHGSYASDIIVIACNTASTLALDRLREQYHHTPFVGVVPAVKPAAQLTRKGSIGVLATTATVNRAYTQALINNFAAGRQVALHGVDKLVHMAEEKVKGRAVNSESLESELQPLISSNDTSIDTLVLACTHFPILKTEIAQVFNKNNQVVETLDSGAAIANRVQHLLENKFDLTAKSGGELHFLFSDEKKDPNLRAQYLRYIGAALKRW